MFRKVISFFTALALVFTMIPAPAFAEETQSQETETEIEIAFGGGDGTINNPYQISNADQLNKIREDLDAYYKLTDDIVFEQTDFEKDGKFYNNGKGWEPIGTKEAPFTGSLDGSNGISGSFEIRGLSVSYEAVTQPEQPEQQRSETYEYYGLFGVIKKAQVKNIIVNGTVGKDYIDKSGTFDGNITKVAGSIVGMSINSKISGCSSYGGVFADISGGIVGQIADEDAQTEVAQNTNESTGATDVYSGETLIEKNYNTGEANGSIAGGLVGKVIKSAKIKESYNAGKVMGTANAGGILGEQFHDAATSLQSQETYFIEDCFNVGSINYDAQDSADTEKYNNAGGIVGEITSGNIKNIYSTGLIKGKNSGGLIGYKNNYGTTKVVSGYYDGDKAVSNYENSQLTDNGVSEKLTLENCKALTGENIYNSATYEGFSFEGEGSLWKCENSYSPLLKNTVWFIKEIQIKEEPTEIKKDGSGKLTVTDGRVKVIYQVEDDSPIEVELSLCNLSEVVSGTNNIVVTYMGVKTEFSFEVTEEGDSQEPTEPIPPEIPAVPTVPEAPEAPSNSNSAGIGISEEVADDVKTVLEEKIQAIVEMNNPTSGSLEAKIQDEYKKGNQVKVEVNVDLKEQPSGTSESNDEVNSEDALLIVTELLKKPEISPEIVQYVDIGIDVKSSQNELLGRLSSLQEKIEFTVKLHKDAEGAYGVIRVHNDRNSKSVEILDSADISYNSETKTLTFKTDKFSTYAIYKYDAGPSKILKEISPIPDQIYTGKEIKPTIEVKDDKGNVVAASNYNVTYNNNINEGAAVVVVTGIGEYAGDKPLYGTFNIKKKGTKTIKSISAIAEQLYTGKEIKPTVEVKDDKGNTVPTSGYTAKYTDNIEIGTATVEVTGTGDYFGSSAKNTFKIVGEGTKVLASISAIEKQEYTGKEIKPAIEVKDKDGKVVTESGNYTVQYVNNINPGTALVIVTGKGLYKNSFLTEIFEIVKKDTVEKPEKMSFKDILTNIGKIRVKFDAVDTENVKYEIAYKQTDLGANAEYKIKDTDETNVLISGLKENTKYTLKIRAYVMDGNEKVYGEWSSYKWAITTPSGKYELPKAKISEVLRNTTALRVKTDLSDIPGDVKVLVKYKKTSEPSSKYKIVKGDDNIRITGLKRNTKYTIKIIYYIKDIKGTTAFGSYSSLKRVYTKK